MHKPFGWSEFDPFGAKPAPDAEVKGLFGAKRGALTSR
jgi:hypothetical protein